MKSRTWMKVLVFVLCVLPLAHLAWRFLQQDLGINPVETLTHDTGNWALRLLLLSLLITPLRRSKAFEGVIAFRRMIGLFAFAYAIIHFTIWFWLDKALVMSDMAEDIVKRRFLTAGMLSLGVMLPLAATSTNGWIKRLGPKWGKLHKLTYVAAVAAVVHFWWLVKSDIREPFFYALLTGILLGWRVWAWWAKRRFSGASKAAPGSRLQPHR